ncbi:MAG: glycosyltransferase family 1 protein [Clostridia bacterium]|nr:glycosyltransferase family 1 protein [Clostridia bacterium]
MKKILCLSTSNYEPFPTRKQNIMNRMVDAEIIYVDPPVTWLAPYKDVAAGERLKAYKRGGHSVREHIQNYASPPVFPFFNKFRIVNKINQRRMAAYLKDVLNENSFGTDFFLWCYSPTSADIIAPLAKEMQIEEKLLCSRTIYDCVDKHSAYPGLINAKVVDEMEENLAAKAGTVFATAQGLYDKLLAYNSNTHLIPNGADYALFSKVLSMKKKDVKTIFGFVGMLQECIDYDCLKAVAVEFPQAKVVLIGRALPGVDLSWIKEYPNIEWKGLIPQEELPLMIKDFDVCLNIFADNELSRDVSPLKFYEYLATGKPIVSTPVPCQVKDFSDCVYIASHADAFTAKCKEALAELPDDSKRQKRLERAKECSWEERVKSMRSALDW